MAHVTPEEETAFNEIMQVLESQPEDTTTSTSLVSVTNDDNIPAQREKLAVLVSTGKSKEAIGVQLTHEQVKRLSDKDIQKYSKRYEAYIGNKTTESLIESFIMLCSKGVGMVVSIDDVKALHEELNKDYIINQELSTLAGGLALRFGRFLALASTALITAKHIKFETPSTPPIVRGPESETLLPPPPPPPRGFLHTCVISKLHPRVFEKCMFALDWLVGVSVQQHSFPQQRVTGYPHQEVS